ncbi:hypothetical protein [Streptomyces sp. CC210A]|uniref:hypothetical protein n=1 Tax=Streptomyces sp. CC210A TaxID=2898184 RepID=UPI001F173E5F|nr:hypothetical protein [Streptomyces sp. CC210A]
MATVKLRDRLRELLLDASPNEEEAAQALYAAVRAAADAQFELHLHNYGNPARLAALDPVAFAQHSSTVDDAVTAFVWAVRREGMTVTAATSDRAKAGRILETLPAAAPWLNTLSHRLPLHRVPLAVSHGAEEARDALLRDVVDFVAPELAEAHQSLLDALECLVDQFAGTFPPDSDGPPRYTEVPPEWKRTDRARYDQTLRDLSQARDAVLDRYKELMNAMSQSGHLPAPQDQPAGQSFNLNTGDNSPVTVNAPYAHATGGSTATAGVPQTLPSPSTDPAPRSPWYRNIVVWTAIAAVAGVGAAIGAFVK